MFSVAGTWAGPGWDPAQSSLLQLLVSVQSLVLGDKEPFFAEPGMHRLRGSAEGARRARQSPNGGWERVRAATVEYAMVDMLRHPPPEFAGLIHAHFSARADHVKALCNAWVKEAEASDTPGYAEVMRSRARALHAALDGLLP